MHWLIIGAVRRYEKNFALHRAHTEDRINLLSSRVNDLSLLVSDSSQHSQGLVNFIFTIPETIIHLIRNLIALPGLVVKRALQIAFQKASEKPTTVSKGKGVKVSKSPVKKRSSATLRSE